MASKAGARAAGTDGSDFAFRQTVDSKYQRAADARAGCKRLLSLLLVYFPAQLMFYVGPIVMNKADVANGRGTPFAACAFVGFALTFAAHAHVRGNKLNARWLGGITKVITCLGILNLAGGVAARAFSPQDESTAWTAANAVGKVIRVRPGRAYPAVVATELMLEIVGAFVPMAIATVARKLVVYSSPSAKTH